MQIGTLKISFYHYLFREIIMIGVSANTDPTPLLIRVTWNQHCFNLIVRKS